MVVSYKQHQAIKARTYREWKSELGFNQKTMLFNWIANLPYVKYDRFPPRCAAVIMVGGEKKVCDKRGHYKYLTGKTERAHAPTDWYCRGHILSHAINRTAYDRERFKRAIKKLKRYYGQSQPPG